MEAREEICQRCLEYRLCVRLRALRRVPSFEIPEITDLSAIIPTHEITACGNCIDAMRKCDHADVELPDRVGFIRAEVEAMDWPEVIGD